MNRVNPVKREGRAATEDRKARMLAALADYLRGGGGSEPKAEASGEFYHPFARAGRGADSGKGQAMTWSNEERAAWREKRAAKREAKAARREANRRRWVRRALVRVIQEVEREAWGAAAREASDLLVLLRRRAEDFSGPEGDAQGGGFCHPPKKEGP